MFPFGLFPIATCASMQRSPCGTQVGNVACAMDWRIRHTIAAMQREIAHPLQLSTLARRVNLSPSRFSHLFRKETGQPPARYLHELRLDSALMLLYDSTLSIKEVMAAVGLNDPSHFTRDFSERND